MLWGWVLSWAVRLRTRFALASELPTSEQAQSSEPQLRHGDASGVSVVGSPLAHASALVGWVLSWAIRLRTRFALASELPTSEQAQSSASLWHGDASGISVVGSPLADAVCARGLGAFVGSPLTDAVCARKRAAHIRTSPILGLALAGDASGVAVVGSPLADASALSGWVLSWAVRLRTLPAHGLGASVISPLADAVCARKRAAYIGTRPKKVRWLSPPDSRFSLP